MKKPLLLMVVVLLLPMEATAQTAAPQAVQLSDAYYTRLAIHRVGSYAMLPLFATQYVLGDRLLNATTLADWIQPAHTATAVAIGALFTMNTVTGVWNLVESRHVKQDRTRRFVHAALMMAADAGFLYTATLAGDAGDERNAGVRHRNAALVSIGLSTAGAALMWFWPDE